jgi:hypothetical protein
MSLDETIQFLFDNINDGRILLFKKMKFGCKFYYLSIHFEVVDASTNKSHHERINITIDNRNNCIEINEEYDNNMLFEDHELVKKWSDIFDGYINEKNEKRITNFLHSTLSKSKNDPLYRELQMKKLFNDESE